LGRATLGIGVVLTVKPVVEAVGISWTAKAILNIIRSHAVLVILGLFLFSFMGTSLGLKVIVTAQDQVRVSGLFGEPAWFGWFTGMCLFIIANFHKLVDYEILRPLFFFYRQ
jgi:hypothetical protein